jgi:thiol-disulfide isomerase/thioredoxin
MPNKRLLILPLLILALLLAACGGEEETTTSETVPQNTPPAAESNPAANAEDSTAADSGAVTVEANTAAQDQTLSLRRQAPLAIDADYINDAPALLAATGRPQFVEFYTTWCPTCRGMKPTVHTLEAEYWGKIDFLYYDREHSPNSDLVSRFQVRGQPVFFLLSPEGEIIEQWFGTVPSQDLIAAFDGYLAEAGG